MTPRSSVLFSVTRELEPSLEDKVIRPHVGTTCSLVHIPRYVAAHCSSSHRQEEWKRAASERSIGSSRALKTARWLAVGEAEVLAIYYRSEKSFGGGVG